MSTERIYGAVLRVVGERLGERAGRVNVLDIGAGRGELLAGLSKTMSINPHACDYHVERFSFAPAPAVRVDLNTGGLPYKDNTFDLVTCSEVVEHLENYRAFLRDVKRVLVTGGLLIVTTPNVLNLKSRLRYLVSGFFNLFGPLPVKNDRLYSTGGHIMPIPYFYLTQALLDAGFSDLRLTVDKYQRTSIFYLLLCLPLMAPGWLIFLWRERGKYKTMTEQNEALVKKHFSFSVLVGRTIIVTALKG